MIDQNKRQTLKSFVAVAGTAAAGSLPFMASATPSAFDVEVTRTHQVWPPVAVPSQIVVSTRSATLNNGLEAVLTNESNQPVIITQLIPSQVDTAHGSFDFSHVLSNGPRQLDAGESIYVPIEHSAALSEQPTLRGNNSLQQALHSSLSIVTDTNIFAAVSYPAQLTA